jgi:hypothetical protein
VEEEEEREREMERESYHVSCVDLDKDNVTVWKSSDFRKFNRSNYSSVR